MSEKPKVKRIEIRFELADGSSQQFTAYAPEAVELDVVTPQPEPIGPSPDLSQIPVRGPATVALRFKMRAGAYGDE